MADVLIYFDENGYNAALALYGTVQADIQEAVDAYNILGFAPLTTPELSKLFTGFEDLMFDKMTEGQPVLIGGYTLNRKKALEILDKPAGYTTLQNKVAEVKDRFADRYMLDANRNFTADQIATLFELGATGEVDFRADFAAALPNKFKIFASSDAAKKVLAFAQAVKEAYETNDIAKCGSLNGDGLVGLINEILPWTYAGASLRIDAKKVARFNNSLYVAS